jgi:hypothetical protein
MNDDEWAAQVIADTTPLFGRYTPTGGLGLEPYTRERPRGRHYRRGALPPAAEPRRQGRLERLLVALGNAIVPPRER